MEVGPESLVMGILIDNASFEHSDLPKECSDFIVVFSLMNDLLDCSHLLKKILSFVPSSNARDTRV